MIRVTHGVPDSGALVVTGGGRGIGAQIALRAARNGTPVAVIYRSRPENAAQIVGEIEAAGGRAVAIQADVGSEADVARAFIAVVAALIMSASTLVPVGPLDGAQLGTAGVLAATGVMGGALLVGLGLI